MAPYYPPPISFLAQVRQLMETFGKSIEEEAAPAHPVPPMAAAAAR